MHRLMLAAGLGSAMLVPSGLLAQEDPKPLTPTEEVQRLVDGEISYDQVSVEVQSVIDAVTNLRTADRAKKLAALMLLLATLFKVLLSGVKGLGALSIWPDRKAAIIRFTTLILGVVVYSVANLLGGVPWWEALALSLSGPCSMIVHEYSRLFKQG